jgi:selenocysteine-specific elongation factor
MRAVVFGTAGHIDHGKTSLVRALTGVDCDRLPEEKRRGITLVLGFAPLPDPRGELEVSFIDVPGHERLVHTMIAGAGGIDRALLVVAADEGVMPQTREHLDILGLLGVRGGVVALNKAELLDADLLELRREEVEQVLHGGPLAGAPVIVCSAADGSGVAALRQALLECARGVVREEERHRPFRIAVDRSFTLPGIGTVVTGTTRWGRVRPGDELLALPSGRRVRVRGVQVHGAAREEAGPGERTALRLAGVSVDELPRGEQLLGDGPWRPATRLALEVMLVDATVSLGERDVVWLHLLASRTPARVERLLPSPLRAGGSGRAVLRLARGLFAAPGDRVVLRRPSPALTLGGGVVLETDPPRLRRREAARLAELPEPRRDLEPALERWIGEAGLAGADLADLAARAAVLPGGLEAPLGRLAAARRIIAVAGQPPVLLAPAALAALEGEARSLLDGAGPLGVPVAEFAGRLVPAEAGRVREFLREELHRRGVLRVVGGRAVTSDAEPLEDPLAARVEAAYREAGFAAPSPAEVALSLGAKEKTIEGIVRFLVEQRRLARVGGKWIVHRAALDGVAASLRAWGVESFEVAAFKERFGLTRKLAIPVLEWLDSQRVTRREGERRRVLPARSASAVPAGRPD